MNVWVQKSRLMLKRNKRGWHCKSYLEGPKPTEPFASGGRDSTKSPQSMQYIRQIRPGDLILLFQVDDQAIHAMAQTDSAGMEADKGSREFNLFYLKPAATAFRFGHPVTVEDMKKVGCKPACFEPGMNGRIFPVTLEEFVGIAKAATATNPEQAKDFAAWLRERA